MYYNILDGIMSKNLDLAREKADGSYIASLNRSPAANWISEFRVGMAKI
jgi:hypothetical protein